MYCEYKDNIKCEGIFEAGDLNIIEKRSLTSYPSCNWSMTFQKYYLHTTAENTSMHIYAQSASSNCTAIILPCISTLQRRESLRSTRKNKNLRKFQGPALLAPWHQPLRLLLLLALLYPKTLEIKPGAVSMRKPSQTHQPTTPAWSLPKTDPLKQSRHPNQILF